MNSVRIALLKRVDIEARSDAELPLVLPKALCVDAGPNVLEWLCQLRKASLAACAGGGEEAVHEGSTNIHPHEFNYLVDAGFLVVVNPADPVVGRDHPHRLWQLVWLGHRKVVKYWDDGALWGWPNRTFPRQIKYL